MNQIYIELYSISWNRKTIQAPIKKTKTFVMLNSTEHEMSAAYKK